MTARIAYTPSWYRQADPKAKGKAKAASKVPKFLLRQAPVLERDELDAALDGEYRAGEVPKFQLRDVAIEGVRALVDAADADALVQLLESEYGGEELSTLERSQIKEVEEVLAKHWPDYRTLREQESRRNRLLPTLSFMRFVDGWENLTDQAGTAIDYRRDERGEIPDELMRRLNPLEIRVVGVEAYRLQYGRSEAKN